MANPAPCQRCDQVPDADYFLTNRLDTPWPYDQSTVALCFHCLVQTATDMSTAFQMAMKQLEEMEQPGVLEQVEADEGQVTPAKVDSKSRSRKSPEPEPEPEPEPVAQEATAAHDLG